MKQPHILIVDDSVVVLKILNDDHLNKMYTLFIAQNGKEAFEILEKEVIDLIFLDIIMPDISGLDVLDQIKSNARLRDIPVIVFSSIEDSMLITLAKRKGAIQFLSKPILPEMLAKHIRKVLNLHE
jgi:CheY-like chemotaxis protein